MASSRRPFSMSLIFLVVVVIFSSRQGNASARFSAAGSTFFLGERADTSRFKKDPRPLQRLKGEGPGRLLKRMQAEEEGTEPIQFFSEKQVKEATKSEYKTIPGPMISTTRALQQGISCASLHSDLHENHIQTELSLRPEWIHESKFIGDCPTRYVTLQLQDMYSPSTMLEAVCVCGGSQCSEYGHQCVPVSRNVPVWVRRGPNLHVLDVLEITVACVCARRPSAGGNFIYNAALES